MVMFTEDSPSQSCPPSTIVPDAQPSSCKWYAEHDSMSPFNPNKCTWVSWLLGTSLVQLPLHDMAPGWVLATLCLRQGSLFVPFTGVFKLIVWTLHSDIVRQSSLALRFTKLHKTLHHDKFSIHNRDKTKINLPHLHAAMLCIIFWVWFTITETKFIFSHTYHLLFYLSCSYTDILKCRSGESAASLCCCHSTESVQMTASHCSYSQEMHAPSSLMPACLLLPTGSHPKASEWERLKWSELPTATKSKIIRWDRREVREYNVDK